MNKSNLLKKLCIGFADLAASKLGDCTEEVGSGAQKLPGNSAAVL